MQDRSILSMLREEKGQVMVIFAGALVALLGITAIAVDVGFLQWQKRHLQNTADAAALAGVRELVDGEESNISDLVVEYVEAHNINADEIDFIGIDENSVTVELKGERELFFARVLGFSETDVAARAKAAKGPPEGMKGLIPIGIQEKIYKDLSPVEGYIYITQDNFGVIGPGNWGWVNLAYPDQPNVGERTDHIMYGYDDYVYIDQDLQTDTGANLTPPGNLNKGLGDRLDEYIAESTTLYIPIICDTWSAGQSGDIVVKGFAAINLTGYGGQGANFWIEGVIDTEAKEFVSGPMNPDAPDYGLKSIALVE